MKNSFENSEQQGTLEAIPAGGVPPLAPEQITELLPQIEAILAIRDFTEAEHGILTTIDRPDSEVAYDVGISASVIRTHVLAMKNKAEVGSRVDLVVIGFRSGALSTDRLPGQEQVHMLTKRETEITQLAALPQKRIAQYLKISPRTVVTHFANAMRKANVSSRASLAAAAIREGVIPAEEFALTRRA